MSYTQRMQYETLRSIDSATLSGSYQALGSKLANPASIVKIINNSTSLVTISIDGIADQDVSPASSYFVYDYTTNRASSEPGAFMQKGTQYYVKGDAGTGLIYLVVQYIVSN